MSCAFVDLIASTCAFVEIPRIVNWAALLGTDAFTSDSVESFVGVVAVFPFISAWAVFVHVSWCSPDELSFFTHDKLTICIARR